MKELISKLQYKNFEAGEFIEEEKRNYEETIALIEAFPWEQQRDHIIIDLTNPSITIEGDNNDYLKLAVFFNQKFVLHYLNDQKILFTKSFTDFKNSYKYIRDFFESSAFDLSDFKEETTWLKNNIIHFVSQNFNYTINPKSIRHFLLLTSGINFVLPLIIILGILFRGIDSFNIGTLVLFTIMVFFVGGGINLILFFNYYFYAKNKILIMSKGNDIFYFGEINSPKKHDKKEIIQYTTLKLRNSKAPINGFATIEIEFKDNEKIIIPNLLIDYISLEQKLYQCKRINKGGIPFI